MPLKIYNTMTRRIDEFIPGGIKKENINEYEPVTIYSCGPTVYSYAHIGNFRTFIFNDLLRRYLKFKGYKVNHAMNITDVDDKTITGSIEQKISLDEYTQGYTKIFLEDLNTLNVENVEHLPKATESIDAMVDILNHLEKNNFIYKKDGSVYFSIEKFEKYGKLSSLDTSKMKSGLRYDTDEYEKDDIRDFVLWKSAKENEPSWETPFGTGRPGWHIECSAMTRKIFNSTIDIHTGGVDLIFPHHENEIAQSEAAYNEQFVRHWIHAEHLLVNGAKMSKSKGNFYTLRDIIAKGYSPRSIRYLLMSAHYRKQFNFTLDGLTQADQALTRIDNFIIRLKDTKVNGNISSKVKDISNKMVDDFTKAMDDDLNISKALGIFFDFIHSINSVISEDGITKNSSNYVMELLKKIDSLFGFIFFPKEESSDADSAKIEKLIEERIQAKKDKNFTKADEIRDTLLKDGIILEDTKDGTRWIIKK